MSKRKSDLGLITSPACGLAPHGKSKVCMTPEPIKGMKCQFNIYNKLWACAGSIGTKGTMMRPRRARKK